MGRFTSQEMRAFSEALLSLYAPTEITAIPEHVFRVLKRIIQADAYSFSYQGAGLYNEVLVTDPVYPNQSAIFQAFETYMHQHPSVVAAMRLQTDEALKISDFISLSQWHRTDLYNEFFRIDKMSYQLGFFASSNDPQLVVTVNRRMRDFTEAERAIFTLLRPHLKQAFEASQLYSYVSDAAQSHSYGWLIVDDSCKIRFATTQSIQWLETYFGQLRTGLLPAPLNHWLHSRRAKCYDDNDLNAPLKEFSLQLGAKRLIIQSLSPMQATEQRLLLREINEQPNAASLQVLGLTEREAEVLLWVSAGKRNSEIAVILGAKPKTITKHLERIFVKLSVETRTSAASVALDVLRGFPR